MSGRLTFGDKGLSTAIKKFRFRYIGQIRELIRETAQIIHAQAVLLAPVDTGNLKGSIKIDYFNGGLSARIEVNSDYAIYVEYGTGIYATNGGGRKDGWAFYSPKLKRWVFTRGMRAQPFWNPAVDAGARHFRRGLRRLG